jgi:hypothetical protein
MVFKKSITSSVIFLATFKLTITTMKKFFLSVAVLLAAATASIAQDGMKAVSGSKTLEVQASSPFAAGRPFAIDNIRARYFLSDNMAVRIQFGIFANNESTVESVDDPTSTATPPAQIILTDKERLFNINIKPGIEKHFEGTDRISPYVGAEIDFAIQTTSSVDEEIGNGAEPNTISTQTTKGQNGRNGGEDGYTRIGLNFVAGADFYIFKNLYLGTEFGWGLQRQNLSNIVTELEGFDGATAPPEVERGGTTTVGTNFVGAFRLGWVF